ncbi:aromatic-ring-hydroxylating dioxygenase subunit beta, partial [Micromonospora sp. WMMD736]|uniref:aromatic-ring-hydroxylating dioxygenase subunit beta n=1 Tax=Micromonospora sp. WMMD736 TaxID=3404112 RepID=UPI003B932656
MTGTLSTAMELGPVPDSFDRVEVEQFLYREARYADESDYDAWEALWTDDALYWVPANGADSDPAREMSIIYDNRSRIRTRLKQARTGKRYAAAPVSSMRRLLSNIEFLGGRTNSQGGVDLEVGANFVLLES